MRYISPAILGLFLVLVGCAHTKQIDNKIVKLAPDSEPQMATAPRTGLYELTVRLAAPRKLIRAGYDGVWLKKGDPIGFEATDSQRLLAVGGDRTFELPELPAEAVYFCWRYDPNAGTRPPLPGSKGDSSFDNFLGSVLGVILDAVFQGGEAWGCDRLGLRDDRPKERTLSGDLDYDLKHFYPPGRDARKR